MAGSRAGGLEALVAHAEFFEEVAAARRKLDAAGRRLYDLLAELQKSGWPRLFLLRQAHERRLCRSAKSPSCAGKAGADLFCSDAFVAKGLVSAASLGLWSLADHLAYFDRVVASVEAGRFRWMSGVHCLAVPW